MLFAAIFSLAILGAGAALLPVVAAIPRLRAYGRFVVPAAAGLSLLGVLATTLEPARAVLLSLWRPSAFFGSHPILETDPAVWPLALAITAATTSASLVQLSRRTRPRFLLMFSILGLTAAALGSLWSANLLTLLIFWGAFDLAWMLGLLAVRMSPRRIALAIGTILLSTFLLWAGAALVRAGNGSLSWHLMVPSGLALYMFVAAAVLRLGLYPIHLTLPVGISGSAPIAAPLFLAPVLGWALLLRLIGDGSVVLAQIDWLLWIGMLALLFGGLLAWTRSVTHEVLPWTLMASAGTLVWSILGAGEEGTWVLAGGSLAWILGATLVYLGRGLNPRARLWTIPPLMGALSLLGTPGTPGGLFTAFAAADAVRPPLYPHLLFFFIGQGLLMAGLLRRTLRPAVWGIRNAPLRLAARMAGLLLPALILLAGGLHPPLLLGALGAPSLPALLARAPVTAWLAWLLAVAAGGLLLWFERRFRERIRTTLGLLFDLFSLDWVLYLFLGGLRRATTLLREVAELVEGAGAVLWALAIFLLAILALVGS